MLYCQLCMFNIYIYILYIYIRSGMLFTIKKCFIIILIVFCMCVLNLVVGRWNVHIYIYIYCIHTVPVHGEVRITVLKKMDGQYPWGHFWNIHNEQHCGLKTWIPG